jgi:hypothetical protein
MMKLRGRQNSGYRTPRAIYALVMNAARNAKFTSGEFAPGLKFNAPELPSLLIQNVEGVGATGAREYDNSSCAMAW